MFYFLLKKKGCSLRLKITKKWKDKVTIIKAVKMFQASEVQKELENRKKELIWPDQSKI